MRSYVEQHPGLRVSVHFVWLPMYPRPMEWWSLPRMAKEFSEWGIPQYWDEERHVSLEVKERIVPDVKENVPWDMFILLGPKATWADAEKHVVGWGRTIIGEKEKLEALLSAIPSPASVAAPP